MTDSHLSELRFDTLELDESLHAGIRDAGFQFCTPIQAVSLPIALAGRDVAGQAQTGTGKTAAFLIAAFQRIITLSAAGNDQGRARQPRIFILAPTRELAVQIAKDAEALGRHTGFKIGLAYGGTGYEQQRRTIQDGVDLLVGTPGRIIDYFKQGVFKLSGVQVVILDEADRMLDMGFIKDVRRIIKTLPKKRQTLLFSATMSSEVKGLASSILKSPRVIQIGKQENPLDTIQQSLIYVEKEQKMALVLHLLETTHMFSVLIFSRTKYGADKINRKLTRANVQSVAIHSNRTQKQRQSALEGFRAAKFQVMVATDIAARGIDVEGITHVINYDVPNLPEDYIHRIGRTGRATATGDAITLVSTEEKKAIQTIEKFIGCKIRPQRIEGFTPVPGTPPVGHASGGRGASQSIHPLAKKSKRRNTSSAPRLPGRKASPTRRRGPSAKRSRS